MITSMLSAQSTDSRWGWVAAHTCDHQNNNHQDNDHHHNNDQDNDHLDNDDQDNDQDNYDHDHDHHYQDKGVDNHDNDDYDHDHHYDNDNCEANMTHRQCDHPSSSSTQSVSWSSSSS